MPPLPAVPGVARIGITYTDGISTFGSRIFVNTDNPGATLAELELVNSDFETNFHDNLLPFLPPAFAVVQVDVRDLSSDTGAEAITTYDDAGTATGMPLSSNVSMDLQLRIDSHYRGGHPVFHMPPGVQEGLGSRRQWSSSQVDAVGEAAEDFLTGVNSMGAGGAENCEWVVLRGYRPGALPEAVTQFAVTAVSLRSYVGTMRRRARALR